MHAHSDFRGPQVQCFQCGRIKRRDRSTTLPSSSTTNARIRQPCLTLSAGRLYNLGQPHPLSRESLMDLNRFRAVAGRRLSDLLAPLLLLLMATLPRLQAADLSAIKVVSGDFIPGGRITHTIKISNDDRIAQADNRGDEMTDRISADLVLLSATADKGVLQILDDVVAWNGVIPPDGVVIVRIESEIGLQVMPGTEISNQADINFDRDGDGTNESSTLSDWPGQPGAQDPTVFRVLAPGGDPPPELAIDDVTVTEGDAKTVDAVFTVSLSAVSRLDVSVDFATTAGSATAGLDFTSAAGTITIPAGSLSARIAVEVVGDRRVEPDETFFVDLTSPSNATLADTSGLGTILDDDDDIDLQIEKECELRGSTVTCTLTASNRSGSDATGVIVRDTLSGASFGPASCLGLTASGPSVLEWSITVLEAETFELCTIDAVPAAKSDLIVNTAVISGDQSDPDPSNNKAVFTLQSPPPGAEPTITMEVTRDPVPGNSIPPAGAPVTFTIKITNNSALTTLGDNPGPEMFFVLAPELRVISASAHTAVGETFTFTVLYPPGTFVVYWNGSLPPLGVATITISAEENPGGGPPNGPGYTFYGRYASLSNQAMLLFDRDGDGTNESFKLTDSTVLVLEATVFLFPHVFGFGENFTTISVAKLNQEELTATVYFYDSVGNVVSTNTHVLGDHDGHRFQVPEGLVGSALVSCSRACHTEGTWEFNLATGGSRVGIDAVPAATLLLPVFQVDLSPPHYEGTWSFHVDIPRQASQGFALAVRALISAANCSIGYFDKEGDRVAEEAFALPPSGHRAEFAQLPQGFEGSGRINCDAPVVVLPVLQDPLNGFPTVGVATPILR